MSNFVIGDIHGEYDRMMSLLTQVNFDYNNDRIISIGDLTDRGKKNWEVVQEFTKMKNKIMIKGNHDVEFLQFLNGKRPEQWWIYHGGNTTMDSYEAVDFLNKEAHIELMKSQVNYYVENNICFVHGGFDRDFPIAGQSEYTLTWDRELFQKAMSCSGDQKLKTVDEFDKIFVGHTQTSYFGSDLPIEKGGIVNIDTGSGKGGKLTIWNLETNEYIQA